MFEATVIPLASGHAPQAISGYPAVEKDNGTLSVPVRGGTQPPTRSVGRLENVDYPRGASAHLALICGAAVTLVNFFWNVGQAV